MSRAIVVPVTPDVDVREWMGAWGFDPDEVIVVVDGPVSQMAFPNAHKSDLRKVSAYDHGDIDADLGDRSWIIPRKTSAIRSYGYYKAWQRGVDTILTLDSDCFPPKGTTGAQWIAEHEKALNEPGVSTAWVATGSRPTRGQPFLNTDRRQPVALNHGMWDGVPDEDAVQKLVMRRAGAEGVWSWTSGVIPRGMFFSMAGMNLAWKAFLTPAMYFGLQGPSWPFDRFDDIWAGLFVKKVCDHLNLAVRSGTPAVDHRHKGDILKNFAKEAPGVPVNERLWEVMDSIPLRTAASYDLSGVRDLSVELSGCIRDSMDTTGTGSTETYWTKLAEAYRIWAYLFKE